MTIILVKKTRANTIILSYATKKGDIYLYFYTFVFLIDLRIFI